ncbi:MAG: sigma-70 family RNA polymerase sigma factor [Bacteroidia bacterium]|nr:sigma-70 family RNA polymerase sigma factor [Bacteroidia bacterium]
MEEVGDDKGRNLTDKAQHDFNLVKSALDKGDQRAYAELMGRYKDTVYFMLLKMVNNKDDAEDLTIEAFGKAFKRLHQYTPNFAFSTWLFKIATNNCIDFIRKNRLNMLSIDKPMRDEEGGEITLDIRDEKSDPEENVIKKQKELHLRAIVDKLKPRYRQLVQLRYFEEKSYEEISQEMDLPVGTVKAQLFRARELLYQVLRKKDDV